MPMIKIEIKDVRLVPVGEIKRNPKNRNKHPKEQIEELARHYSVHGMRTPLIASNQSGMIVAGDGRFQAALKAKMTHVPVSFQDFGSPEKEFAFGVADNGLSLWSELDLIGINDDLKDMPLDFNIDDLGLKDFLPVDTEVLEPGCDEDEVPEFVEPKTKLGDLYKLGNHRLLCGDSTNIQHVEKLMDGQKADMVFTDPPYNQETEGGFKGNVGQALKKQSSEISHLCDFNPETFLQTVPCVFESKKMNAYIFCSKDLVVDYLKWARDSGFSYNILIWKKPSAIPLGGSFRPDIEYLLTFRKSAIWNGGLSDVHYSKVLEHSREKGKVHPTMKPVEMIENQLKISSNEGSPIVDFFGGSGSTLIACEKTKRKCFMMELDPKYCDVIIARFEKFSGQKAEMISG